MPELVDQPPDTTAERIAAVHPPLPAVEPVHARRIHWLLAFPAALIALLFPRRLGPHLARSSWAAAYLAHLLSLIVAFGAIGAFQLESMMVLSQNGVPSRPNLTWSEELRRPLAAAVLSLREIIDSPAGLIATGVGVAALEAGFWVAALLLIPLYTAGERRKLVYLRCVKLLLWSTACVLPLSFAIEPITRTMIRQQYDDHPELLVMAALLLWGVWSVSVLLRLGSRYGGPREGPGWEPRPLRCEACAYELTSLSVDGRCPECGRPVAESLPSNRRIPGAANSHGKRPRWAYFRTVWQSLFPRRFARTLCVRQGHAAARRFLYATCLLIGLVCAVVGVPQIAGEVFGGGSFIQLIDAEHLGYWFEYGLPGWQHIPLLALVCMCAGGLVALTLTLLVGLAVTLAGFQDATTRSIPLCYSSAWLIVPVTLALAGIAVINYATEHFPSLNREIDLSPLARPDGIVVLSIAVLLPAAAALIYWVFHLRRLLCDTRHANA